MQKTAPGQISRDQLKRLLDKQEDVTLIEVLPREYYRKEHIARAINIPLDKIELLAPKLLDKNQKIVVYCADEACQASPRAAQKLRQLGYQHVWEYRGGKMDWKEAKLPMGRFV